MTDDYHEASTRKLAGVAGINAAGFAAELAGGLLFGSVALLGDAVHMLFDALAYGTALIAALIADRIEASDTWPYGMHRVEVLAALLNGLLLVPMAGYILWTAYRRFLAPVEIAVVPALAVAVLGLLVNLASVRYLRGDRKMGLNERSALYHLLGDAGGSVAVIVGLGVYALTGSRAADPLAAAFIALLVIASAGRVLLEGFGILMQKSPIDPDDIAEAVLAHEKVDGVHGVRTWKVCSRVNVCTLHVALTVESLHDAEALREDIEAMLKDRFALRHVTIQIEDSEG